MKPEAVIYFYPNGLWGGYDRFFSPSIPDRVGRQLVHNIKFALLGDEESKENAIMMLKNIHLKNINKAGSKPPFPQVKCYPTEEAKKAIYMLLL